MEIKMEKVSVYVVQAEWSSIFENQALRSTKHCSSNRTMKWNLTEINKSHPSDVYIFSMLHKSKVETFLHINLQTNLNIYRELLKVKSPFIRMK